MWPLLIAFLLVATVALHFWWQRRYERLRAQQLEQERALEVVRTQHEQVFAQRQAQQSALFDSMTEGVLVLDAAGRIQLVNQSLQRLFALTADVRGQTIMEAFRQQELATLVNRLPHEQTVQGYELELPGLNPRGLEINATAFRDSNGNPQGSMLVVHDLTRLRQLENTRREFVANVSHELRTPLSLIKGFVETLIDGAKNDPETANRFLQTIEKHTNRLTYLIEDLLTISRLESGQIVMNRHPVDLREEAARVMDDLQARAAERKVTLENLVPAGLTAQADADRLQQVLFNLIENAIKYGRDAGRVSVGGKPRSETEVELWVRDDGPGIPTAARERVFERFYRVDRARSAETGGTGLGLSIVKHIIQAHGGEVGVKSEPGTGTNFFFTLPRN
ncbi:MAG: PAS domain-containing protein [Verrucomicrobia bacterium]|nr:PAS domain-containing protein [Verrucomicrobiota bacterium]